ncbi:bacteriohemerythrin [Melioribacteraceae bacterium 4301-Me]|uniref:bacteriohemerythrin n=1 Tax=Pyranulibacter aquaticus TaxID=3163344 RepID=UPI00359A93E4
MQFIKMTKNELVNVSSIDEQHKKFVDVINKLFDALQNNNKKEVITYLDMLIEDLETHFEHEETLMKTYNYPGYISHKLEHDRIYNKIVSASNKNKSGEEPLLLENLDLLKRWFFNHLDINDKKLGAHLIQKGIK